jgi:hypothetical protein
MAQTIKLKRSATQGATPTTSQLELGEIAINTYDGKVFIKKNDGTDSIVEVTATNALAANIDTFTYTATATQTTFSGSDDNAATLSYTAGQIQVFLNGVLLDASEYTASNGTSVVLGSGAAVNDILTVIAYQSDNITGIPQYSDTTANFTGALQNGGSNVVVDSDIGSTIQAYDSNLTSFVSAFTLPTTDGTADQVLTTNGSGTLSFATASGGGGGGGGSFTATASGALSNGDLVVVNSDGTVSVVEESTATESLGTGTSYESGLSDNQKAVFDSGSNKVIVVYRDYGNSDYGTAVVGTVSGTSISFGTPVVFANINAIHIDVTYDAANDKVVVVYRDTTNSNYGTAIVGTVSGTSISFGTAVVFNSGTTSTPRAVYDSANGKVVIVWGANGAVVGTVSGTSISFGSTTNLASSGVYVSTWMEAEYDSTNGKIIVAFSNLSNSYYGEALVGTVSGTSISFGSKVTFLSSKLATVGLAHDSANNKMIIAYENDDSSDRAEAIVGTVSGTSISFGSPTTIVSNITAYHAITYDSASGEVVVFYSNTTDSDNGYYAIGSVSGTSITFGTPVKFANDVYYLTAAYDTNSKVSTFFYYTGDTSNMQGRVFRNDYTIQNLTSENYVGISDGDYSSGATATIQIVGSVDDAQTGLTPGQAYYVQNDGTLSETPDTPSVFAGTAISSTKLIIKG